MKVKVDESERDVRVTEETLRRAARTLTSTSIG